MGVKFWEQENKAISEINEENSKQSNKPPSADRSLVSNIPIRHTAICLDCVKEVRTLPDVIIICGNAEYSAHREILEASSAYFKSQFTENTSRATVVKKLNLPLSNTEIMEVIMCFSYSGQLTACEEMPLEFTKDLLITADLLQLNPIIEYCLGKLAEELSVNNFCELLTMCELYGNVELGNQITQYLAQNLRVVLKNEEFLRLSARQLKDLLLSCKLDRWNASYVVSYILKWSEFMEQANDENREVAAKNLLVTLPLMELLSDDEVMDFITDGVILKHSNIANLFESESKSRKTKNQLRTRKSDTGMSLLRSMSSLSWIRRMWTPKKIKPLQLENETSNSTVTDTTDELITQVLQDGSPAADCVDDYPAEMRVPKNQLPETVSKSPKDPHNLLTYDCCYQLLPETLKRNYPGKTDSIETQQRRQTLVSIKPLKRCALLESEFCQDSNGYHKRLVPEQAAEFDVPDDPKPTVTISLCEEAPYTTHPSEQPPPFPEMMASSSQTIKHESLTQCIQSVEAEISVQNQPSSGPSILCFRRLRENCCFLQVYNIQNKHWSNVTELPFPVAYGMSIICYKKYIAFIGGMERRDFCPSKAVILYSPNEDVVLNRGNISSGVCDAGTTILDDDIVIVGGTGTDGNPTDIVQLYNPNTRCSRTLHKTKKKYRRPFVLPFQDGFCVLSSVGDVNDGVEHYSIRTRQWTLLTAVPGVTSDCSATILDSRLFVVRNPKEPIIHTFDFKSGVWTKQKFSNGPEEIYGLWPVGSNENPRLLVLGTHSSPELVKKDVLYIYDVASLQWMTVMATMNLWNDHTCVVFRPKENQCSHSLHTP